MNASRSEPALGAARRPGGERRPHERSCAAGGAGQAGCGRPAEFQRIPSCFRAHKAMAEAFHKSPGLFAGDGDTATSTQEAYFPVEMRDKGVAGMAYQRRQAFRPEVHRASASPWPRLLPKTSAGAGTELIHRDMR